MIDFGWMATDVGEWFHADYGFIRSDDDETWIAVPRKAYNGGVPLKGSHNSRQEAALALVEFVNSCPRPKLSKQESV